MIVVKRFVYRLVYFLGFAAGVFASLTVTLIGLLVMPIARTRVGRIVRRSIRGIWSAGQPVVQFALPVAIRVLTLSVFVAEATIAVAAVAYLAISAFR